LAAGAAFAAGALAAKRTLAAASRAAA
jgi:hypothetical protein